MNGLEVTATKSARKYWTAGALSKLDEIVRFGIAGGYRLDGQMVVDRLETEIERHAEYSGWNDGVTRAAVESYWAEAGETWQARRAVAMADAFPAATDSAGGYWS